MNGWVIVLLILVAAGVIFLIVKAAQAYAERERQRKAGLAYWAAANGFLYSERDPWNFDARYRGVDNIGTGHDRYAFELVTRQYPVPCAIFRYHYKTWETRTVTRNGRTTTERYEATHWERYLIVELGAQFPGLTIRPEGFMDKVSGFFGFDDINFESEAFSKRYYVKSDDRQFAYALIHPQVMEWLLPQAFQAQVGNGLLFMDLAGVEHTAAGCQQVWVQAVAFVNQVPPFVWQDYGKRDAVVLPAPVPFVPPPVGPPAR